MWPAQKQFVSTMYAVICKVLLNSSIISDWVKNMKKGLKRVILKGICRRSTQMKNLLNKKVNISQVSCQQQIRLTLNVLSPTIYEHLSPSDTLMTVARLRHCTYPFIRLQFPFRPMPCAQFDNFFLQPGKLRDALCIAS